MKLKTTRKLKEVMNRSRKGENEMMLAIIDDRERREIEMNT